MALSNLIVPSILAALAITAAQAPPARDPSQVLKWSREGGFAGFCDELTISTSGEARASSCRAGAGGTRALSPEDRKKLDGWRDAFANVAWSSSDAGAADGMTIKLTLAGRGRVQPTTEQRQQILDWVQKLFGELRR